MIPILTYHSMHIHGNDYEDNDLVALARDLETIRARGLRVLPLAEIVRSWLRREETEGAVAITCDDGGDFDFHDLPHPTAGMQRSVLNNLADCAARHPGWKVHATAFVIVSPEARVELDKSCMIGRRWWNDAWWPRAAASGLMHVANHSWDHNHDALPPRFHTGAARGTFKSIASRELADAQIRVAAEFLRRVADNPGTSLFAYPYGESNEYLEREYFPRFGAELGIVAALGIRAEHLHRGSDRWNLPRFVFGRDWKRPGELEKLLDRTS